MECGMLDILNIKGTEASVISENFVDTDESMTNRGGANVPHSDCIQLIPTGGYSTAGNFRSQYALAEMSKAHIEDCFFYSKYSMQGLTLFDGILREACITNCRFLLQSPHEVTLNGLVYGDFSEMFSYKTSPVRVLLNKARIAGGLNKDLISPQHKIFLDNNFPSEYNIYKVEVASFKQDEYNYIPVSTDNSPNIIDTRFEVNRKCFHNFNLLEFRKQIEMEIFPNNLIDQLIMILRIALNHGEFK